MDRMIYIAMDAANQTARAQAVNANNLANASTTAFRADLEALRSISVDGAGYASRAYSQTYQTGVDLSSGSMMTTGRTLDVALSGKGYIAVQAKDGTEAYTRRGDLKVTSNGQLLTGAGNPVIGNGGPIALPPFEKLEIGVDGTITIRGIGQSAAALTVVDRIRLVDPDGKRLSKNEQGLLVLPQEDARPNAGASVRISSGTLESSNVNAIEAMVAMLDLARQFELNIKMVKSAEDNETALQQVLRLS